MENNRQNIKGTSWSSFSGTDEKGYINRNNFIKKIIRIGLLAILSAVSFILAGRITTAKCEGCPAISYCNGKSECRY